MPGMRQALMSCVRKAWLPAVAALAGGAAAYILGRRSRAAQGAGVKPALNDAGLTRKVESIIFRPEEAPKGRVSVNAEDGVIFLRGEVETQEQIDMLVRAAEQVDGVREVRSLMHLPGTPAPSKDDPHTRLEQETIARD